MSKKGYILDGDFRGRGGRSGFTLVEVLAALAILGGGLFILLETQYVTLRMFSEADEVATFQSLLERAIGDAERAVLTGESSGEGDFGLRYPEYAYSYHAEAIDQTELPGLYEVVVKVMGPEDEVELRLLVYDGSQEDV